MIFYVDKSKDIYFQYKSVFYLFLLFILIVFINLAQALRYMIQYQKNKH